MSSNYINLNIKYDILEKEIIIAKKELNDIINEINNETNSQISNKNVIEPIFINYDNNLDEELSTKFLLHEKIDIFFEKRDILNSKIRNMFDI
jgi:hypothetical protein